MKLTGAQIVWECLVREGVTDVFGYPGGAILPAYDAMVDYPIRHILVRHEQGATHMADGYARASGRVGVAIATSGPGATNMVTGIATAMMDSSPIVCITGQVSSQLIGTDAFQETDITGITLPITKHNWLVTRAADVAPAIHEAFLVARSGRPGPVLVDIAKDAQQGSCEFDPDHVEIFDPAVNHQQPVGVGTLDDAIALINAARRPVILAGHGVTLAGAEDELGRFAERAQIPVAVTLLGIGSLASSHPLNLGMMGLHGEAWVNGAIQEADLLIALGMRFDDRVTGDPRKYAPNAHKIHVDVDASELNKIIRIDVGIVGDLRQVVRDWLPRVTTVDRSDWLAHIDTRKGDAAVRDIKHLPDEGHLYAAHVMHDLSRLTDGRALVVTDVGQHQMWEAQYYKHETRRSLVTSGGLGTMGFALPAAIGAKIACPDKEVWVVVGDGGFQMTMAELATVVQEDIDIKVAIINNGYLGMVRQIQHLFYDRRYVAVPITGPDYVKLAGAYGLWSMAVERRAQVVDAVTAAREHRGTAIIDFRVEQEDLVYPTVRSGAALHDMIRRPAPIVETAAD
jgi:acetolactate synthase-1/2/3 large subunit